MKTRKLDLIYRNTGKASATKIQQTALSISRSNAKDAGPWNVPSLISAEGSALAKHSQPRNAFAVPYLDDPRQKFAVSDTETEAWRKFKPGDDPGAIVSDPLTEIIAESDNEEEPEEFDDAEPLEEAAEENMALSRTRGAFDRHLLKAIGRLIVHTKKKLVRGRDSGRSYGRDNRSGRSYSACTGCIGGRDEWNKLFAAGELS
jgi:hypothetical protein